MTDLSYILAVSVLPIGSLLVAVVVYFVTRGDEAQAKAERLQQKHS